VPKSRTGKKLKRAVGYILIRIAEKALTFFDKVGAQGWALVLRNAPPSDQIGEIRRYFEAKGCLVLTQEEYEAEQRKNVPTPSAQPQTLQVNGASGTLVN
jgi:hypothetical protein